MTRANPRIPPRENRTESIAYDRHRERNVVERYRRAATGYDKKTADVPGVVGVASFAPMLA